MKTLFGHFQHSFLPIFFLFILLICGCSKTPKEYFQEGMTHYKNEDDAEAIEYFNKAIELDSSFFEAYLYLGKSYFFSYQRTKAIKVLIKAKKIKVHNDLYEILGESYEKKKKNDKAIEVYEEGLKYYPQNDFIIYNLANCYYKQKQYEKSLGLLNNLMIINPDSFDVFDLTARNFYSMKDFSKSIEYFKIAISKAPPKDFLYYDLARAYIGIGQLDSALISASKAVQLNDDDEENLFLLSSIFLIMSKEDSADFYYDELKDLIITNNPSYYESEY